MDGAMKQDISRIDSIESHSHTLNYTCLKLSKYYVARACHVGGGEVLHPRHAILPSTSRYFDFEFWAPIGRFFVFELGKCIPNSCIPREAGIWGIGINSPPP